MRHFTFLLLWTVVALAYSQTKIVDDRDGNEYEIVKLGNNFWMKENLLFNAEGSLCEPDCDKIRFYDYRSVASVCPDGWRLPTMLEWNDFVDSYQDAEVARMMEENPKIFRVDFLDKYDIFKENVLNIAPYGRAEGGKVQRNKFIDYWTTNTSTKDQRFHMHLTPQSIVGHGHKHHLKSSKREEYRLFPVRCVCEADKL